MPPRRSLPTVKDEEMPEAEAGALDSGSIAEEPAAMSRELYEVIYYCRGSERETEIAAMQNSRRDSQQASTRKLI
jgi:hypothetical protein